ncbi:uncharacterized protein ColSpa_12124 [Colletotrichum spaethianum]|uniref:Uncharacterized protein n=1 Tax=Colletotrichum spaethianum TaxID=700344 RepID=A0AA37PGV7_9PEZI|nr:uncharacterized protein ColSpa_12124 [Colletotrichum spaethianum]GKT51943.1 hypothetical protein ColSpa_12124 [Colletotrichum spaethianum]
MPDEQPFVIVMWIILRVVTENWGTEPPFYLLTPSVPHHVVGTALYGCLAIDPAARSAPSTFEAPVKEILSEDPYIDGSRMSMSALW